MNNYSPEGLSRLYAAIKQQAEQDLLLAIERDYPVLTETEKVSMLSRYRRVERKIEQRFEIQSRGKL